MSEMSEPKLLRLFYVLLFYFIYGLTDMVLLLIVLVQSLLNLFGDGPSETIKEFGAALGVYVKQIAGYLSYHHEQKPYPFSDWPVVDKKVDSREL